MPKSLLLIFSRPTKPEVEVEYFKWYTQVHLSDIANVPGVVGATFYKIDKNFPVPGINSDPRSYLAIYELEAKTSEALNGFVQNLDQALSNGSIFISETIDMLDITASFAMPITEHPTAPDIKNSSK